MIEGLAERFRRTCPAVEHVTLRWHSERTETIAVRSDVLEPWGVTEEAGVLITVREGGGAGYAATSDVSDGGLTRAFERARLWARRTAGRSVEAEVPVPAPAVGRYAGPVAQPWGDTSVAERVDRVREACARLAVDDRIVDRQAALQHVDVETLLLTSDGGEVEQRYEVTVPFLVAVAHARGDAQVRTLGGRAFARQGGLEVLDQVGFAHRSAGLADEAIQLLLAPNCPSGRLDVVLAQATGLDVKVADDPTTCVARGTSIYLENLEDWKETMESDIDDV